ncbi:DUF4136 domain-containing protein [Sphingomonas sp. LHG3406-1]|uniref:DUF4136 domain-containing protein n=1 Tax=Sphingomonas sp. LHG3406-1 TaxID=2804617 RepID=UPI0026273CB3|nr:DUF4136 domain-containing protein [Sphingomonas sp. LHG3406-1]
MTFLKKLVAAALVGAASVGLSGCATGLPAKVTRFQAMPAPQGQSFYVVPGQGLAQGGGLEFSRYAELVSRHLAAQGYAQAANPAQATMIVQLGYEVDKGTERVVVDRFGPAGYDPFYRGFYSPYGRFGSRYDPFYGIYYGRPYYSRFGYWGGGRSAFYYGWNDPFWFGGPDVRQYTEYKSELDIDIRRRADNQQLFDGRAQARSTTDNTQVLVPNLIEAMFTGFPGRNGETVKITVPAQKKR